jgi:hypothetical protein
LGLLCLFEEKFPKVEFIRNIESLRIPDLTVEILSRSVTAENILVEDKLNKIQCKI